VAGRRKGPRLILKGGKEINTERVLTNKAAPERRESTFRNDKKAKDDG